MIYYIKIGEQTIPLIFGLKSLIQLSYLIKYNKEISMEEVLQLGTRVGTNDILISSILKKMPYYKKSEVLTLVSSINIPSLEKIKDLYQKSVGEMNISSTDFFDMTEDEIEDAYNGYLRRKELEANLVLLALNKSLANDTKPIKITKEKNYIIGSLEERKQTFDSFNV